ncbi:MAG: sensor histidine kinase [Bacteroidales bacterium]
MKSKTITITIVVTTLALIGVIITQLYWVKNSMELQREQFHQNVQLGMKRVVNQLMALQNDTAVSSQFLTTTDMGTIHNQFIRSVDPDLIDSMISRELRNLRVSDTYYYGVVEKNNQEFIIVSNPGMKESLLSSVHQVLISCIFQKDQYTLSVYFPQQESFIMNRMILNIILSAFFMLVIIGSFMFIITSLFRQKRLSEIKTDFVNNMTHEFKTPISTVSVASEMLMKENVLSNPEKIVRYAQIIYDENIRLKNQVEHVLQVAILDRRDYKLKLRQVDVHELLEQVSKSFDVPLKQRDGELRMRLNAADSVIYADRNHLTNVFHNLLDNANKYSPERPEITVSTTSSRKGIKITVQDRGIGMPEDQARHIFKKFHRIPTGNIHDVKGFGIGLYYVRTIVEAHAGTIKVHSSPGKGSDFVLFLPFGKTDPENAESGAGT